MTSLDAAALATASLPALLGAAFAMGALHGLEPGHAKTLMAAFIIAVRGTVGQAIVLGLAAAASHSAIVWALGLLGAAMGNAFVPEAMEPWFMIVSGLIIVGVGCWMLIRLIAPADACARLLRRHHRHDHPHDHPHGHPHEHEHTHDHGDAHAAAHAHEIETRFASGRASLTQTLLFGLSGGLIPCPAAITVLILCLHLGKLWLGFAVVSAFSLGLAVTLVGVGVVSALGLAAARRNPRLDAWLDKAPYVSGALILAIGLMMMLIGLHALRG